MHIYDTFNRVDGDPISTGTTDSGHTWSKLTDPYASQPDIVIDQSGTYVPHCALLGAVAASGLKTGPIFTLPNEDPPDAFAFTVRVHFEDLDASGGEGRMWFYPNLDTDSEGRIYHEIQLSYDASGFVLALHRGNVDESADNLGSWDSPIATPFGATAAIQFIVTHSAGNYTFSVPTVDGAACIGSDLTDTSGLVPFGGVFGVRMDAYNGTTFGDNSLLLEGIDIASPPLAITPTSVTLCNNATQAFASTVSANWTVVEGGGGSVDPSDGTAVVYTAPDTPGTYHLKATDPTSDVWVQAVITVVDCGSEPLVITPHEATLCAGGTTQDFTTNLPATFEVLELNAGTVDPSAGTATTYTAPDWPGTYHLKASTAGGSEDTAILTVVDCGSDDAAVSSWGSCSCTHSTRQVPAGLLAHLQTEALTLALCMKLEQANGTTLGFTTHDRDLTFDDVTYETLAGVQLSAMRSEIGGSVDNLDLTGLLQSERVSDTDLRAGLYDGAAITLYLVNWSDISDSTQRLVLHRGSLGEVRITDGQYHAEFRSLGQRLQQKVGEAYSPLCRVRQLGDERCAPGGFFADGATLADYQFSGRSVVSVTSGREFVAGADSHNTGYYNYGRVWFDSGANANIIREVKKHTLVSGNASLVLQEPFPFAIEVGDTLTLEAGCNRTPLICRNRFANMLNFQGEPFLAGRGVFKKKGRR